MEDKGDGVRMGIIPIDSVIEKSGFHLLSALETPAGGDQVVEGLLFGGSRGLVFFLECTAELGKGGLLFGGGQDDAGGGEAVFQRIEAASSASFRGAGASALFGVPAIGSKLTLSDHPSLMLQGEIWAGGGSSS